jgi:hypothetical protein
MKHLLLRLWRDEVGLVQSTELVFLVSIVALGMLVGLSAYRDGVVAELADDGRAVGALNQSYSLSIAENPGAGITVAGDTVTITKSFGNVTVETSFNNYSYTDQPDYGDGVSFIRSNTSSVNEADPPPTPL